MIKLVRDKSTIIQAFKDKNLSTGLYVVSFELGNITPIPYNSEDVLVGLVNLFETQRNVGESLLKNLEFKHLISKFKAALFADMQGKIKNTPYLIYFVNEVGLEQFGFFFNVEFDDNLRFCIDWREYVKGQTK